MDKKEYMFSKFLDIEIKKINVDKWIEGEKISADPGENFIHDWIKRNASNWRKEWDCSKCKHCKNWKDCSLLLKTECDNFCQDEIDE